MSGEVPRFMLTSGYLNKHVYGGWVRIFDYATLLAERDRARDIAARLEGECAALGRVVRLAQYVVAEEDETFHLPEMRALCIGLQDLADKGLLPRPHPPGDPTPWPHPDAEVTT